MNEQHEDKSQACRIRSCGEQTQASRKDRVEGRSWLCPRHRAPLTLSAAERAQLDVLARLIAQNALALDGAGWMTRVKPQPPPKPTPIVMDDGVTPRYLDWRSDLITGGDDGQG